MDDPLLEYRPEFPILEKTVYMISNSLGAMPRKTYERLQEYAEIWATRGVRAWAEKWWTMPVHTGDLVASLIGAQAGQVSMHQNVTLATAIVLSCFSYTPERNKIVFSDLDFPSVMYLLQQEQRRGAQLNIVQSHDGMTIDQEELLDAIDEQTLLVPVSHVLFKSAYIQDAAAIVRKAHSVGAYVILDAFQSVGTVPVDVQALQVDFLIGGALKWLCGGPGAAFLYVRPDLVSQLSPALTGWMAHQQPFDFEPEMRFREDAYKFMNGTPNIPGLYAAQSGLEIINRVGVNAIREKSTRQTEQLLALADMYGFPTTTPRDPAKRGGTVALNIPSAYAISKVLKDREFIVDYRPGAGIRISPHFYSSDEELDLIMAEVQKIIDTNAYANYAEQAHDIVT